MLKENGKWSAHLDNSIEKNTILTIRKHNIMEAIQQPANGLFIIQTECNKIFGIIGIKFQRNVHFNSLSNALRAKYPHKNGNRNR